VHRNPPTAPRWRALLGAPWVLLWLLLRRPRLWRHAFSPRKLALLYRDAALAALAPALVHWQFGAVAVGREGLADLLPGRWLVSFRGYDLNHTGLDRPDFYAALWRAADAVHVLGEHLARRAAERGCPPELPLVRIPPAVGLAAERSPVPAGGPLRVLSVGRAEWKKGGEYALQAIALLVARGIELRYVMVGDGELFEALAFARHQLGLEERVELRGALPPAAVQEELARADVFLHLAVSEAFCNAVLEAQAAGVPVVCSDAGGLPENVADGETGFVVPRRDPAAAAARLAQLAADPGLRARMGAAGRARVARLFDPERQLDAFEALYREVLAR
jgi:colanic acid/amylovoran biosynthesis glycosyltransferase